MFRFDPVRLALWMARNSAAWRELRCGVSAAKVCDEPKHPLDAPFLLRDDEAGIRGVAVGGLLPVNMRRSPWRSGIELYGTKEQ